VCCNFQTDHVDKSGLELSHIAFFKGGDGAGHITCITRTAKGEWKYYDGLSVFDTTVTFTEEGFVQKVVGKHPTEYLSNVYWAVYTARTVPLAAVQELTREKEQWRSHICVKHDAEQRSFEGHHAKVLLSLESVGQVTTSERHCDSRHSTANCHHFVWLVHYATHRRIDHIGVGFGQR
jgi:hypothetical protein